MLEAADLLRRSTARVVLRAGPRHLPVPGPYPASCSPQAWASAAPVHLIRVLLRFDPLGWEDAPASIQTERPVTTITGMCSRIAQAADRRGRPD
jgi:hypothetical protein